MPVEEKFGQIFPARYIVLAMDCIDYDIAVDVLARYPDIIVIAEELQRTGCHPASN